MKTIFISDTHIGINSPENWYQQSVHQPYLQAILNYIQQSDDIQDVVILGDWFDTWTYLPDSPPPDINSIINANPDLFTVQNNGLDFISCAKHINGNFYYIRGNHDMTIAANDLQNYFQENSITNFICPDLTQNYYDVNGTYAEHGNAYDVLCRLDKSDSSTSKNPYWPLPIGYFISRFVALYCQKQLATGQNAANLSDDGNPNLAKILYQKILENSRKQFDNLDKAKISPDIASTLIMDILADLSGMSADELSFTMPDGNSFTANQIKNWYPTIFYGLEDLEQFVQVDMGNSLQPMPAKELCNKYHFVIMGHTHEPIITNINGSLYANSGFICPAIPDMQTNKANMTFVEVDESNGTLTEYQVNYPQGNIIPMNSLSVPSNK